MKTYPERLSFNQRRAFLVRLFNSLGCGDYTTIDDKTNLITTWEYPLEAVVLGYWEENKKEAYDSAVKDYPDIDSEGQ